MPDIYDEPFADSSQIPTTLVSEFARRHVTVALSGDSGDEFFGGCNHYFFWRRLWRSLRWIPGCVKLMGRDIIDSVSAETWDQIIDVGSKLMPSRYRVNASGDKMHKLARILGSSSIGSIYENLVSWPQQAAAVALQPSNAPNPSEHWSSRGNLLGDIEGVEGMMFIDQMTYMTDDILCKVDRASMSVGLESRAPFLDNDLTEFAWSLPLDFKINGDVGKWPLRQILKRYIPEALFERPKMGFGIPVGDWVRGPFRDWAEDLLSESNLRDGGWLNVEVVRKVWMLHLSGQRNMIYQLWPILMFLSWKRKWIDRR